jgi:hypothetical protein
MNDADFQIFFIANILSNIIAILILIAAWLRPPIARVAFVLIFSIACWVNWQTVIVIPEAYQTFAQVAVLPWYQQFIQGWFRDHTLLLVGFIATCQGLIAMALLGRGWVYKAALLAGTIFLLAVIPLGFGSAFPCTLILAIALILLWRRDVPLFSNKLPVMHHGHGEVSNHPDLQPD